MKTDPSETSNTLPSKRLCIDCLIHCCDQDTDSKPVSPQSLDSCNTFAECSLIKKICSDVGPGERLTRWGNPTSLLSSKIPQYLHDEETSYRQFCCVFSSDFIGDLENYTFLKTRWYKQSENQCFHLHRYPHGSHLGFFKMAAGKCIFVHFSASKCH